MKPAPVFAPFCLMLSNPTRLMPNQTCTHDKMIAWEPPVRHCRKMFDILGVTIKLCFVWELQHLCHLQTMDLH
jgi:hypothetical protein